MKTFAQSFSLTAAPSNISGVSTLSRQYNGPQALATLTHAKGATAQIAGLSLQIVLVHAAYNGGGKMPEITGKGNAKDALRAGFAAVTAMPVCKGGNDPRHLRASELDEAVIAFAAGYDAKVAAINAAAADAAKVAPAQSAASDDAADAPAAPIKAETPEEKAEREAVTLAEQAAAVLQAINLNDRAMRKLRATVPGLLSFIGQQWATLTESLPTAESPAQVADAVAVVELAVAESITVKPAKASPRRRRAVAA